MINIEKLKEVLTDAIINELYANAIKFDLTTNLRLAHLISQCSHESNVFKALRENLNYNEDSLLKIFPRYFTADTAKLYARNPEKIASKIYANRMGNGDEQSQDGYKFRGRGYIELTGKANYQNFSEFIGEDCITNPDLIATKYPLSSAMYFFNKNKLWSICDQGETDIIIKAITKHVNGGFIGIDDRIKKFNYYYNLLK